jgi:predicted RNA binding protein YcfA (HicA-like mRNA interferase family)
MSRQAKLIEAFKNSKGPYPYRDLCRILVSLGYVESTNDGSRRAFIDRAGHIIRIHEPHPNKEVLPYVVRAVREALEARGMI